MIVKVLLLILVAAATAFSFLVRIVIKEEWSWWGPRLADGLVRLAVLLTPIDERDVREREWTGEIATLRAERVPGVLLAASLVSAGLRLRAMSVGRTMRMAVQQVIGGGGGWLSAGGFDPLVPLGVTVNVVAAAVPGHLAARGAVAALGGSLAVVRLGAGHVGLRISQAGLLGQRSFLADCVLRVLYIRPWRYRFVMALGCLSVTILLSIITATCIWRGAPGWLDVLVAGFGSGFLTLYFVVWVAVVRLRLFRSSEDVEAFRFTVALSPDQRARGEGPPP